MRSIQATLDQIFRAESPRVLSTLIRLVGDFDLAEDSMQAAFATAAEQWAREGVPKNPTSWLISTARFKAVDSIRRKTRLFSALREYAERHGEDCDPFPQFDESCIEDDRLRLIFTCCHPALSDEAQTALTLREVCGLTTEEIARAYLTPPTTIGQRIVRAKAKIREEQIPYELPAAEELPERVKNVLAVAYLLFNEGYYATSGESLTRQVLSNEAIRLARLLAELAPEPEVFGLLALMLLQESRRPARTSPEGDMILFDDQDTNHWDRTLYAEGVDAVSRGLDCSTPGNYALQAAIAALHMNGAFAGKKDWPGIVSLYDLMLVANPSAIVELNRAVAVSMVEGEDVGLAIVDRLLEAGGLEEYAIAHSTRADLCRRLGKREHASLSYARALALTTQGAQRRFLEQRLKEVSDGS